jgi:hypothetical protein
MFEDEELPPDQEEDDGSPEDREVLFAQLEQLAQNGPSADLFQVGLAWLHQQAESADLLTRAAALEAQVNLDDPLVSSQLDRLEEAVSEEDSDQVLYALLSLGSVLTA